jgi:hypothetical protein
MTTVLKAVHTLTLKVKPSLYCCKIRSVMLLKCTTAIGFKNCLRRGKLRVAIYKRMTSHKGDSSLRSEHNLNL